MNWVSGWRKRPRTIRLALPSGGTESGKLKPLPSPPSLSAPVPPLHWPDRVPPSGILRQMLHPARKQPAKTRARKTPLRQMPHPPCPRRRSLAIRTEQCRARHGFMGSRSGRASEPAKATAIPATGRSGANEDRERRGGRFGQWP